MINVGKLRKWRVFKWKWVESMEMFMIFIGVALLLLTIPTATTFTESFNEKRNIIVGIICGLILLSGMCLIALGINHYLNIPNKYQIINAVCYT